MVINGMYNDSTHVHVCKLNNVRYSIVLRCNTAIMYTVVNSTVTVSTYGNQWMYNDSTHVHVCKLNNVRYSIVLRCNTVIMYTVVNSTVTVSTYGNQWDVQ